MKKSFGLSLALLTAAGAFGIAQAAEPPRPRTLLQFGTMYGVDGPFTDPANPLFGIAGDDLPWELRSARGKLSTEGRLQLAVHGLVFTEDEVVPPELRGTNDEEQFRAAVSCITEDENDQIVRENVISKGFPADEDGNAVIHDRLALPDPCIAPVVFVLAGSEDKWFAVTGFESEEEE